MIYFFQSVKGFTAGLLIFINLLFFGLPVILLGLVKLANKNMKWQVFWTHPIVFLCSLWGDVCVIVERIFAGIEWDVQINTTLDPKTSYLLVSNHQSNADVPVLLHCFQGKIPFMRFFVKAELKKLPIFGFAWQSIDCPFMGRYTKAQIAEDPSLRQKDLEQTIESCRKFRYYPTSIVNFSEGTRLTPAKKEKYQSPYEHLLPPRAGGVAFTIAALEGRLDKILDVTIFYHGPTSSLWDYFCGRIPKITVTIEPVQIPEHFALKDYQTDPEFKLEFQGFMNALWARKDLKLKRLHESQSSECK